MLSFQQKVSVYTYNIKTEMEQYHFFIQYLHAMRLKNVVFDGIENVYVCLGDKKFVEY